MLISLIVVLIIILLLFWLVSIVPVPADAPFPIKTVLYVLIIIGAIIYLLRFVR